MPSTAGSRGTSAAIPTLLVSEISARVVAGIHALDLTRVNRIAATLIRNCERDIVRSLQRRSAETARHRPIDEEVMSEPREPSVLGLPDDLDAETARRASSTCSSRSIGADARLVVAIAVVGERQHAAADALGLKPEAGRKRYQRALRRLRVQLREIV